MALKTLENFLEETLPEINGKPPRVDVELDFLASIALEGAPPKVTPVKEYDTVWGPFAGNTYVQPQLTELITHSGVNEKTQIVRSPLKSIKKCTSTITSFEQSSSENIRDRLRPRVNTPVYKEPNLRYSIRVPGKVKQVVRKKVSVENKKVVSREPVKPNIIPLEHNIDMTPRGAQINMNYGNRLVRTYPAQNEPALRHPAQPVQMPYYRPLINEIVLTAQSIHKIQIAHQQRLDNFGTYAPDFWKEQETVRKLLIKNQVLTSRYHDIQEKNKVQRQPLPVPLVDDCNYTSRIVHHDGAEPLYLVSPDELQWNDRTPEELSQYHTVNPTSQQPPYSL